MSHIDLKENISPGQGKGFFHFRQQSSNNFMKKSGVSKPFTSHLSRISFEKMDAMEATHFKLHKNIMELNMERKGIDLCSNFVKKMKSSQDHRKSEGDEHYQNIEKRNNFFMGSNAYKSKVYFSPTEVIRKNRKEKVYPRYKILELFALYKSIIQYSKNSPEKFLHAFESALTFQKINIRPELIKKNLFNCKKLEFQDFVSVYKRLEELTFIQSISDYLEIIFEVFCGEKMKYQEVYALLLKRSEHTNAIYVTETIWRKLGKEHDGLVSVQEILDLCERDLDFCSEFGRLYKKEGG